MLPECCLLALAAFALLCRWAGEGAERGVGEDAEPGVNPVMDRGVGLEAAAW